MEPTLSIMVPTVFRPTLARTLASIRTQVLRAGDEVILITDGAHDGARELWEQYRLPGALIEHAAGPTGDWGHTPRNLYMPRARASHILAIDDDDELTPHALPTIRAALALSPDRPHMFRGDFSGVGLGTLWREKELKEANVATPLFVVPTAGRRFGTYTPRYGGDCDFIRSTLALYPPGSLVWREEVICTVRPLQRRITGG